MVTCCCTNCCWYRFVYRRLCSTITSTQSHDPPQCSRWVEMNCLSAWWKEINEYELVILKIKSIIYYNWHFWGQDNVVASGRVRSPWTRRPSSTCHWLTTKYLSVCPSLLGLSCSFSSWSVSLFLFLVCLAFSPWSVSLFLVCLSLLVQSLFTCCLSLSLSPSLLGQSVFLSFSVSLSPSLLGLYVSVDLSFSLLTPCVFRLAAPPSAPS